MKLLSSYTYWILNFVGWILFSLLMLTIDKISYGNNLSHNTINYLLVEGVLCGFLGFLLSFIILYYIERYLDIAHYTKADIYKVIGIVILTQILYHILLWPLLSIPTHYYFQRDIELSWLQKLTNVPHFLAYFLVWLFVILTLKFVHYINTIKVNQLQLETNLKDAQLNTLKGQINPHFMFNSLNNIRGLMLEDVSKARNMLTSLSEMLRYALTKSGINSISLEDELDMVENYIAISKIQFEERLVFENHIDEQSLDKQIPPMIIQILIENAIKHGISNLKDGGIVTLSTALKDDKLHIEVTNSGRLQRANDTTQLGVENIKQRLKLLYGGKALFSLVEKEDMVVATIKIPAI